MKTTKMLAILVLTLGLIASVANADFTFGTPTNLGLPVNSSAEEGGPRLVGVPKMKSAFATSAARPNAKTKIAKILVVFISFSFPKKC